MPQARPLAALTDEQQWELASRVDLQAYAEYVHGYAPPRHARVWLDTVQAEVQRETTDVRVLIFDAPPGHAKSSYLSEVLPTWFLGTYPGKSVVHLTGSDNLAGLYHAAVEDTLKLPDVGDTDGKAAKHARVFAAAGCRPGNVWGFEKGLRLAGTTQKVSYKMAGYGSNILGLRGDLIILDDPLTEEKSTSELELTKAKRYFTRTVWTRKQPGTVFVLINTRWGYDDLTAYVLEKYAPRARLIHMPALGHWRADGTRVGDLEGEALWPEYISRAMLREELHGDATDPMSGMGLDDFLTIFQGEPGNPEGNKFNPDLIQPLPNLDLRDEAGRPVVKVTSTVQSWDLAFTQKTTSDYTVAATLKADAQGNVYLVDLYEKRIDEAQFEGELNKQAAFWRPHVIGIEAVSAAKWIVQGVDRRTILPIRAIDVGNATKEARASLLALLIQKKRFYADRKAPSWLRLAQQLRQFPKGRHDDLVDAIAQGCHLLITGKVQVVRSSKALHIGTYTRQTLKERMAAKRRQVHTPSMT